MKPALFGTLFCLTALTASAQEPTVNKVESPTVKVLTGLTVSEFEQEMQHFVQAVGVSCAGCHMPNGSFASDENPRKVKARQMIEMTRALNQQFFPGHARVEGGVRAGPGHLLYLPPGGPQAEDGAIAGCEPGCNLGFELF